MLTTIMTIWWVLGKVSKGFTRMRGDTFSNFCWVILQGVATPIVYALILFAL
jgi:hypothetical protein